MCLFAPKQRSGKGPANDSRVGWEWEWGWGWGERQRKKDKKSAAVSWKEKKHLRRLLVCGLGNLLCDFLGYYMRAVEGMARFPVSAKIAAGKCVSSLLKKQEAPRSL